MRLLSHCEVSEFGDGKCKILLGIMVRRDRCALRINSSYISIKSREAILHIPVPQSQIYVDQTPITPASIAKHQPTSALSHYPLKPHIKAHPHVTKLFVNIKQETEVLVEQTSVLSEIRSKSTLSSRT